MSTVFFYNKYTATVLIQAVLQRPCMALTGQADFLLPYSTASFAERHRHIAELPPVFVFILCMHSPNVISFRTSSPWFAAILPLQCQNPFRGIRKINLLLQNRYCSRIFERHRKFIWCWSFPQSFPVSTLSVYCIIAALSLDKVKIREP